MKTRKFNNKRLGRQREFNLVRRLQEHGYVALATSQSAGGWIESIFRGRHPEIYKKNNNKSIKPIDITASKLGEHYYLQVSKHKHNISSEEITVLIDLANQAMATPVLGWIENQRWKFCEADNKNEVKFWK